MRRLLSHDVLFIYNSTFCVLYETKNCNHKKENMEAVCIFVSKNCSLVQLQELYSIAAGRNYL